jgi:dienelactone hydrolase
VIPSPRACAIAILFAVTAADAPASGRTVSFRTDDGVTLMATWYEPSARIAPAVILVHMLHRTRQDWDGVATRFAAEGIGALAVDLRGHGESGGALAEGETADYTLMVKDIAAARRFLASRGEVQGHVGIAGASLGANLATLYASTDPGVVSLALLSPSLDYRGVRIEQAARKYGARPMLLVVSDDDPYATRSAKDLEKAGGGVREILPLAHAGHGTTMLGRDENLVQALVDWFKRTLL